MLSPKLTLVQVVMQRLMSATYAKLTGGRRQVQRACPPHRVVPGRGPVESQLEDLKQRLLKPVLETVADATLAARLRAAANEAAALAWYTACPVLFLPDLLEEKVRAVFQWWEKQEQILHLQGLTLPSGARPAQAAI